MIFKVFKEVQEHQSINHLVRKYLASEIRGDFENQMLNRSPKVSIMINWRNIATEYRFLYLSMTQQSPEADEVQMSKIDIEDSSSSSN